MDRYESAALLDFVASIVWPTRTVRLVSTPGGESEVNVIGTWVTATDIPMAWVNGNRITGVTWVSPTRVALGQTVAVGKQVIVLVSPGSGSGYLPRNPAGVVAMLGDLMMGANRVRNLGAAVEGTDGVRLDQVQALIQAALGGNYVAKAGDQMGGVLKLIAANLIVHEAAAVRRDMVALLDASQDFTGKIKAPSTIDTDPATTLTTKDWVEAYVATALANTQAPNEEVVFSTAGGGYTWTAPAGVRKVWVYTKGAKGGNGGGAPNPSGVGALGGIVSGSIPIAEGATFSIIVGGNGQSGGTHGGIWPAPGGGGGGASQVSVGSDSITGGGGGGGGGGGDSDNAGGAGGGGGQGGNGVYLVPGGVAGNGITTAGGIGGYRGERGNLSGAGNGSPGSGQASDAFNTTDTFPFQTVTDPNAGSGSGLVIIKWYEA